MILKFPFNPFYNSINWDCFFKWEKKKERMDLHRSLQETIERFPLGYSFVVKELFQPKTLKYLKCDNIPMVVLKWNYIQGTFQLQKIQLTSSYFCFPGFFSHQFECVRNHFFFHIDWKTKLKNIYIYWPKRTPETTVIQITIRNINLHAGKTLQ